MNYVYVYATDSYTEVAIKDFLKKINENVNWVIKSPQQQKKSKAQYVDWKEEYAKAQAKGKFYGKTGESLIEFMISEIRRSPVMLDECIAFVVEDDLDDRAEGQEPQNFIKSSLDKIYENLSKAATGKQIPKLIYLLAAPEVEGWFFADWNRGFGNGLLNHEIATKLKGQIASSCNDDIESYSVKTNGKLSEKIELWISELAIQYEIVEKATYSKRNSGPEMLRSMDVNVLHAKCRKYFAPAFREIQLLS